MVMGVPESGVPAAEGFARASGIPYGQGLVKNRYIGRSFIAPDQKERADAVRRKLNPLADAIAGKRLVVVDDSIVRGTTQRSVIKMLREAGAAEVHLRISSPPWRWPCFYGIDTPSHEELLATNHTVEEMARVLGADSLAYISIENLKEAIGADGGFCDACFTGDYPTPVPAATTTPVCSAGPSRPPPRPTRPPSPGSEPVGQGGATYAGAGVDIAAGDAAVERLRAMVSGIGGFGGQFPLDIGRYPHAGPGRVDRRGRDQARGGACHGPLRHRRHRPGGHVRGRPRLRRRRAAVHARLHRHRQGRPRPHRHRRGRRARGMPPGRLRADRRRDGRARRRSWRATSSTWPGSPSAWWRTGTQLGPAPRAARRRRRRAALARPALQRLHPGPPRAAWSGPGLDLGDPAWAGARPQRGRRAAAPVGDLHPGRAGRARGALGDALHACAHITGGGIVGQPAPGRCPREPAPCSARRAWEEPRIFGEIAAARVRSPRTRWTGSSTGASAWRWWWTAPPSTTRSARWPRQGSRPASSARSWPAPRACASQ